EDYFFFLDQRVPLGSVVCFRMCDVSAQRYSNLSTFDRLGIDRQSRLKSKTRNEPKLCFE
ncbi:MAG TPA: hypothetical protein P5307_16525, partial [Pirellulaceae bacterium]|nr:hypothetical protein [Pirellulaceae bacterium]